MASAARSVSLYRRLVTCSGNRRVIYIDNLHIRREQQTKKLLDQTVDESDHCRHHLRPTERERVTNLSLVDFVLFTDCRKY